MLNEPPKRYALFGLPGSGKSTFASRLGKILNIPVHHLDRHYFLANWEIRDREEFLQVQQAMVSGECWIIEGNSIASLQMRFAKADLVIYFRLPRLICLWRVLKRAFWHDKSLLDTPEGCSKNPSWRLLQYMWRFHKEKQEKIDELRKKYPQAVFHVIRSSKDAEKFLQQIPAVSP